MDGAARRVKATDIARLTRLRERREEEAARELRRLAEARAAAERARAAAADLVRMREAERALGERQIYDDLCAGGPMGLTTLEKRRTALSELVEALDRSRQDERARAADVSEASARQEEGRVEHARRSRENQQWGRARDRIRLAQRRHTELMDDIETEDDILMRRGKGSSTP